MAPNIVVRLISRIAKLIYQLCVILLNCLPGGRDAQNIATLIFAFPFYFFWICLDRLLFPVGKRFNPFVQFPRDTIEVIQRGELLFELMKQYDIDRRSASGKERDYSSITTPAPGTGGVNAQFSPLPKPHYFPREAQFVSMTRSGETDSCIKEDLKKIQVSIYTLTYLIPRKDNHAGDLTGNNNKERVSVDIFVKTPAQRTIPRHIEALAAAFNPRGNEQRFYEDIFPHTNPELTNVPHSYASWNSRLFGHVCIVTQKVDTTKWKSITDAQGMTLAQGQAIVKASARLHAQFWNPGKKDAAAKEKKITEAFPDKTGINWLGFVNMFFSDKEADWKRCPPWMPSLWPTLCAFFEPGNTCISHADFRPGNMLFSLEPSPNSKQSADAKVVPEGETVPSTEIVITDWEGCAITPATWDFAYSLGFPPHERRQQQRYLWELHFSTLVATLKASNKTAEAAALCGDLPDNAGYLEKALPTKATPSSTTTTTTEDYYVMKTVKDRMELEVDIVPLVVFFFGWSLTKTGNVGETQGNNEGDSQVWGDRARSTILDAFLCDKGTPAGMMDPCNDGFSSWTTPQLKSGRCSCKDVTSMEELGRISKAKGNLLNGPSSEGPHAASRQNRCKSGPDGAVINAVDPDYSKMHLSERIVTFLQPYHDLARKTHATLGPKCQKKNPRKFNRTLREDLLDMVEDMSKMGMGKSMKEAAAEAPAGGGKPKKE